MNKINEDPRALFFIKRDDLKRFVSKDVLDSLDGNDLDCYGVILQIKAIDRIDTPELFMEYGFGKNKCECGKEEVCPKCSQNVHKAKEVGNNE